MEKEKEIETELSIKKKHLPPPQIKTTTNTPNITTRLFKPKTTVIFFIYLTHMVPVIGKPDPSHHQNTIHTINISFKSESYINT